MKTLILILLCSFCFGQVKEQKIAETDKLVLARYTNSYYLCAKTQKYECFAFPSLSEIKEKTNSKGTFWINDLKITNYRKTVMLLQGNTVKTFERNEINKITK